jgi:hypothetical protein
MLGVELLVGPSEQNIARVRGDWVGFAVGCRNRFGNIRKNINSVING